MDPDDIVPPKERNERFTIASIAGTIIFALGISMIVWFVADSISVWQGLKTVIPENVLSWSRLIIGLFGMFVGVVILSEQTRATIKPR